MLVEIHPRKARAFSRAGPRAHPAPRRPQVNLKSTTGETVRVPTPPVDYRSLELALKVRRRPAAISRAARTRVSNDRSRQKRRTRLFFFGDSFSAPAPAPIEPRSDPRSRLFSPPPRSSSSPPLPGGIRLAAARARVLLRDHSAPRRAARGAVGFAVGSIR